MPTLPPKLYFRIGEVASLVGVEPHVLRYWEREFRSIRPTKSAKGQRVYSRRDVENLMRVRDLLYADGFTIAGAKKKLQRTGTEPDSEAGIEGDRPGEDARSHRRSRRGTGERRARVRESCELGERRESAEPGDWRRERSESAKPPCSRGRAQELRGEIEAFLAELGG